MKTKVLAVFFGLFLSIQASQAALFFFPVGFLIYLSPTCDYRPIACLFFEEGQSVDGAIKATLADKYSFLDNAALEDLTSLVNAKLNESGLATELVAGEKVEVSLEEEVLMNEVLLPSGAFDFFPVESSQLVEDFR